MWGKLNYWWRLLAKTLSFGLFGIGALLLSLLVFPVLRVCAPRPARFRRAMRKTVSLSFAFFVGIMTFFGLIRVNVKSRETLKNAKGKIVVANHPSLIDVVILISLLPQADCIIKSRLRDNPFIRGVVGMYIPNSLDAEQTVRACADSVAEGNCLVIFPEGTRTVPGQESHVRRGSAQLALRVGCGILPVRISASDPTGLRKGDRFFSLSREGRSEYIIEPLPEIPIENYDCAELARSARILTNAIKARIIPPIHQIV